MQLALNQAWFFWVAQKQDQLLGVGVGGVSGDNGLQWSSGSLPIYALYALRNEHAMAAAASGIEADCNEERNVGTLHWRMVYCRCPRSPKRPGLPNEVKASPPPAAQMKPHFLNRHSPFQIHAGWLSRGGEGIRKSNFVW